ncbi:hypothetical protein ACFV5G_02750 [Streptomyces sp. NPDC059766]|uniref:hypothetical protein n=1 Tax=Streptomyces sp. NPDC059766 TaxID=3346940 RepID=UPI003662A4A7
MAEVEERTELISEIRAVIDSVMPGATVMDLPSVIASEAVSITAFDESETRAPDTLADALIARLRTDGWAVDERERTDSDIRFHAARVRLGGGAFAVQAAAVSFHGLTDHEPEAEPHP